MSAIAQRELRCSRNFNQQSLCQYQMHKNRCDLLAVTKNLKRDCLEASQAVPRDPAAVDGWGNSLLFIAFKNSPCQDDRLSHIGHGFAHVHAGLLDQRISLLLAELPLFHQQTFGALDELT